MREIQVTGYIARDPEVKTSSNGRNFIVMSLSNREWRDEKDSTKWFNISVFDSSSLFDFVKKHIKKGSLIRVFGEYNDTIFQKKDGTCDIDRRIIASVIDFLPIQSSSTNGSSANNGTMTTPTNTNTANVKQDEVVIPSMNMTAQSGALGSTLQDDLPF